VSYEFWCLIINGLIIFISRDTTSEVGTNGTDLFNVYAVLQYPRYCFNNALCKSSFQAKCLNTITEPTTRALEVPLLDGEILRFEGRVLSVTQNYDGSEGDYQIDVHFSRGNVFSCWMIFA